jgi:hypothetical protein
VLNDIVSYVRLLLFQQPDNTHGIYLVPSGQLQAIELRIARALRQRLVASDLRADRSSKGRPPQNAVASEMRPSLVPSGQLQAIELRIARAFRRPW